MGTGLAGFGLFWEEIAAWSEQAGSWMLLVNITPIDWTLGQGVKRRTVEKPRAWLARLVNITYNVCLNAPGVGRLVGRLCMEVQAKRHRWCSGKQSE